jgi:hypothetical protein
LKLVAPTKMLIVSLTSLAQLVLNTKDDNWSDVEMFKMEYKLVNPVT